MSQNAADRARNHRTIARVARAEGDLVRASDHEGLANLWAALTSPVKRAKLDRVAKTATACYAKAVRLKMSDPASWEYLAHRLDREARFHAEAGMRGLELFCLDRARDCLYRAKWTPGHVDAFLAR
jgi:hypothetical protein